MSSSDEQEDTDMADDSSEQEFESPQEVYQTPEAQLLHAAISQDDPGNDETTTHAVAAVAVAAAVAAGEPIPTASQEGTPMPDSIAERQRGRKYQARDITMLQHPPQFLGAMRQTLFDLNTPVELKPEEFELYWPFVDNVWVRQHKAGFDRSGKNRTDYYACRLQRPTYTPRKSDAPRDDNKQRRNKKTRQGGTCQMRIKTVTYEGEFRKITVQRVGEHSHTHDLDAIDQLKRNTVVMDIGRTEVMKGFMPTSVFNAMKADSVKLNMVGGKFLKVNDVRNASMHWRNNYEGALRPHPDAALSRNLSVMTSRRPPDAVPPPPRPPPVQANGEPAPGQPPPLPSDTLFFPPTSTYFLQPYLPPASTPAPDASGTTLPHVTVAYATSLDSLISLGPHVPTAISGLPSKAMTHYLRSRHDAIIVGVGTAICDDPTLNCRLAGAGGYGGVGWSSHPRPVIIDPGARWDINTESKLLKAAKAGKAHGPWIIVQPGAVVPPERVELLSKYNGRYLTLHEVNNRFRLPWEGILKALAQLGIRSVMVEGGGMVLNELLGREENARLISSVILTVAPMYLGFGGVAVSPQRRFGENGVPVPVVRFRDVRWAPMGEDVIMCARITRDLMQPPAPPAPPAPPMQAGPPAPPSAASVSQPPPPQELPRPSPSPQAQRQSEEKRQASAPAQSGEAVSRQQQESQSAEASPAPSAITATTGTPVPSMQHPPPAHAPSASPGTPTPMGNIAGPIPTPPGLPSLAARPPQPYVPVHLGAHHTAQAAAQEELRRRMQAHARNRPGR